MVAVLSGEYSCWLYSLAVAAMQAELSGMVYCVFQTSDGEGGDCALLVPA